MAGLFDGEGSVGLSRTKNGIHPNIRLSMAHNVARDTAENFLRQEGISCYNYPKKTPHIAIATWPASKIFTDHIAHLSIEKRPVLLLLQDAIALQERLTASGKFSVDGLDEFIKIRERMHSFANKGPKILKPWRMDFFTAQRSILHAYRKSYYLKYAK